MITFEQIIISFLTVKRYLDPQDTVKFNSTAPIELAVLPEKQAEVTKLVNEALKGAYNEHE